MAAAPLMFKAVISRDEGTPWGETGMTSAKWLRRPVRSFQVSDLIATQPGVLIHALTDAATIPYGGDPLPHVVEWNGQLYLEDGHHRAVRALLAGSDTITARWLRVGKIRAWSGAWRHTRARQGDGAAT